MTYLGIQEQAQPYIDKVLAMSPTTWRNISVGWNLLTYDQVFWSRRGRVRAWRVCEPL